MSKCKYHLCSHSVRMQGNRQATSDLPKSVVMSTFLGRGRNAFHGNCNITGIDRNPKIIWFYRDKAQSSFHLTAEIHRQVHHTIYQLRESKRPVPVLLFKNSRAFFLKRRSSTHTANHRFQKNFHHIGVSHSGQRLWFVDVIVHGMDI